MFGLMRARTCVKHTDTWRQWRNHYCGTCKTIGSRYGQAARMALNHDTVFLAELLTALSPEPAAQSAAYRSFNCMTLPKSDQEMPTVLRYSAAATLVLAEFKVVDHIEDTGRRRWRTLARVFSKAFRTAQRDLEALRFPVARLREALCTQSAREREGTTLADFSAPTAEATALFFAHGAVVVGLSQACAETLETLGRRFGELAYLLDAFEDYEKDEAAGAFNAIRALGGAKRDAVPQLQSLTESIRQDLGRLPLNPEVAASFASRLKANLDAKLGLHICKPRRGGTKASRKHRWDNAVTFARGISADSPKWRASMTVAAVALVAYLAPSHSRAAATPSECLSLGFNLMALGSMFAMAVSGSPPVPPVPPVDPSVHPTPGDLASAKGGKSKSGCCGSCGCDDCCCDCNACNCGCCACESMECCGGGCDCCSGCGDCCGSCDCGGCDC